MRNLTVYSGNAFDFHKTIVASKRNTADDPTYKERLSGLDEIVQPLFQAYDERFNTNELELLTAHPLTDDQRNDLLKLYSYKSARLQKLKVQLTTLEFNKVLNTCQCCTIGEVSSLDHLVPKGEFPEFAVNPKNLFPSCHKCNSYKQIAWRNGEGRTFLNLFLDDLPQEQYLFVDLQVQDNAEVRVNFVLRNDHGLDDRMFTLLSNHYANLYLFNRFKENADSVITPLIYAIKSGRDSLNKAQMFTQIKITSQANQAFFGPNYWKSILEIALANNQVFIDAVYNLP